MNPTPPKSPQIEVTEYPAGSRFIGPGDDVVISAEKLRALIAEECTKARIDEVESMGIIAVDIPELSPLLSARLAQLKTKEEI